MTMKLKLEPFAVHLHGIIDELQEHDTSGIFAHPVLAKEVGNGEFLMCAFPVVFNYSVLMNSACVLNFGVMNAVIFLQQVRKLSGVSILNLFHMHLLNTVRYS
jgi:hypothetical protein